MEVNNTFLQSPSYKGLTSQYKKAIYSKEGLTALQNLYPTSNGIVGNVPFFWVKNMPAESRKQAIKGLYADLGKFFSLLRDKIYNPSDLYFEDIETVNKEALKEKVQNPETGKFSTFQSMLTRILKKYHAIESGSSVKIDITGSGGFSCGLTVTDKKSKKKIFIKLFNNFAFNNDWQGQGPTIEANNNVYIQNNLKTKSDKKHFPKFYYADTCNGYYIEEHLDDRGEAVSEKIINENSSGLIEEIKQILEKISLADTDKIIGNIKAFQTKSGKLLPVLFDCGGIIPLEKFKTIEEKYNTIFKHWL